MPPPAIRLQGIGKRYDTGVREPYQTLREAVMRAFRPSRPSREPFWALRDLSFDVQPGEAVGIIGRNGAGKTTLLRILSRVTAPTCGTAEIRGRVGSLLEVGTGFHPELTGRENIFLNGAILGMRRREILRAFDAIVDFSGIPGFLDTPVKRYSSGMAMRLAFSVAAHLEPEVLLVDEVLSVGDAAFQRKCVGRMDEISKGGRTILFVSHDMLAIQRLCRSALLLDGGRAAAFGPAGEVVRGYLDGVAASRPEDLSARADRRGDGRLRFLSFAAKAAACGAPAALVLGYEGTPPLRDVEVSLGIFSSSGEGAAFLGNAVSGQELTGLPARGALACRIPRLPLRPGSYSVNVYGTVNGILADWIVDAARFEVAEGDFFGTGRLPPPGYGAAAVDHAWEALA